MARTYALYEISLKKRTNASNCLRNNYSVIIKCHYKESNSNLSAKYSAYILV